MVSLAWQLITVVGGSTHQQRLASSDAGSELNEHWRETVLQPSLPKQLPPQLAAASTSRVIVLPVRVFTKICMARDSNWTS